MREVSQDFSVWEPSLAKRIDEACDRFEAAWHKGMRPAIEELVSGDSGEVDVVLLRELLVLEIALSRQYGRQLTFADYLQQYPNLTKYLQNIFANDLRLQSRSLGQSECQGADLQPTPTLAAGRSQLQQSPERFQILSPHADGGFGRLFRATDMDFGRDVVIKVIKEDFADVECHRLRFIREAQITGSLEHPGIVPVYGFGVHSDGKPYYAMRLLRGGSFLSAIASFHASQKSQGVDTRLDLRKLLQRFIQVCETVSYAHSRGVVHRDLKPDNIMVGAFGETLVVDWGLAKLTEEPAEAVESPPLTQDQPELTMLGAVLGSPAYMSPEQADAKHEAVSTASDVFCLGATLYHLLTGRAPFQSKSVQESLELARACAFPSPRSLQPSLPPCLEAICLKAMARSTKERYSDARELSHDVEHFLADEPTEAFPDRWPDRFYRWQRRHQKAAIIGMASLFLVAAIILIALVREARLSNLERQARSNAEVRGKLLQREFAKNLFARGTLEYERGNEDAGILELHRAWFMMPADDPLRSAYRDVLVDRGFYHGRLQCPTLRHGERVSRVAISPDNSLVVSVGEKNKEMRVWDSNTGKCLYQLPDTVFGDFNTDGSWMTTISDGVFQLRQTATGKIIDNTLNTNNAKHHSFVLSPDGLHVASLQGNSTFVWKVNAAEPLFEFPYSFQYAKFAADGRQLTTISDSVRTFSMKTGTLVGATKLPGVVLCLSDDCSKMVITGGSGNAHFVSVVDTQTGTEIGKRLPHDSLVLAAAISTDCNRIVTGSKDRLARIWDASEGALIGNPILHDYLVARVDMSADGTTAATSGDDQQVRLWRVGSGRVPERNSDSRSMREVLETHPKNNPLFWRTKRDRTTLSVNRSELSIVHPLGRFRIEAQVVSLSVIDVATAERIGDTLRFDREIIGAAFHPQWKCFVTVTEDRVVRFWSISDKIALLSEMRHSYPVFSLTFSADGTRLATSTEDNIVYVWQLESGVVFGSPLRHSEYIREMAFTADGRWLATASGNSVRVWDAATGTLLGTPLKHNTEVIALHFHGSDCTVVTRCATEHFDHVWDCNLRAVPKSEVKWFELLTGRRVQSDGNAVELVNADWLKLADQP